MAETVRRAEEASGEIPLDDPATRTAGRLPGHPAARIVERARLRSQDQPGDQDLAVEVEHALSSMRWLFLLLLAAGLLAGIAAAASLPAANATIALSQALIALLGIPLLLLGLWAGLSLRRAQPDDPQTVSAGLPGRVAWWLLTKWTRRFGLAAQRRHLAAALAELGRREGRKLLALATHGFWTMFFIGCIAWLWLRFLGLRFDFSWETTLLAGDSLQQIILAIGWLPAWLFSLSLPGAEQIEAILGQRSPAVDRQLWAGYLLSALAVYGLAPRALLALWFAWRCRALRLALDLGQPGYLRLLPVLAAGPSEAIGKIGPDAPEITARQHHHHAVGGQGRPVLIGVELDRDESRWPPENLQCRVLGRADNRRQQRELLAALKLLDPPPRKIVALCSLARTPDRGIGHYLGELSEIAPLQLQLEDGESLPAMGIDAEQRRLDWRRLGERFGLEVED
ncbi:MAG: DUF2868 domain-containing protein [Wenzhouxiangellaceae bacterium]|nr:DUF2868 domain-containing protein [Wenzhouxiangellaceae bacterium]